MTIKFLISVYRTRVQLCVFCPICAPWSLFFNRHTEHSHIVAVLEEFLPQNVRNVNSSVMIEGCIYKTNSCDCCKPLDGTNSKPEGFNSEKVSMLLDLQFSLKPRSLKNKIAVICNGHTYLWTTKPLSILTYFLRIFRRFAKEKSYSDCWPYRPVM